MSRKESVTYGINSIYLYGLTGCDEYHIMGQFSVSSHKEQYVKADEGHVISLERTIGHTIRLDVIERLEVDLGACEDPFTLVVQSWDYGDKYYAIYEDCVGEYVGTTVGNVWIHQYRITCRNKVDFSPTKPVPLIELEQLGCSMSLVSPCWNGIEGLSIALSDIEGAPIGSIAVNSNGDMTLNGSDIGHRDSFFLPFSYFKMTGTYQYDGVTGSFEEVGGGSCGPIVSVLSGSATFVVTPQGTTSYKVTVTTSGGQSTSTYSGPQTINFSQAGTVTIVGCSVTELYVTGNVSSLSITDSCLSVLSIEGSTCTSVVGGQLLEFTGNGDTVAACNWPLITYIDHDVVGAVDLSCFSGLQLVDLSNSGATSLKGPPSLVHLDLRNTPLSYSTANVGTYPNLEYVDGSNCSNWTFFDFDLHPSLETVILSNSPMTSYNSTQGNAVTHLYLDGTQNSTLGLTMLGSKFPNMEVLYWYNSNGNEILYLDPMPNIRVLYVDSQGGGDPNPFIWVNGSTTLANLDEFTYINAINDSQYMALLTNPLVQGGAANCSVNILTGNVAPDSTCCSDISTLISRGCTVQYPSGGPC